MKLLVSFAITLVLASTQAWSDTIKIATGELAPYSGVKLHKYGFACHVVVEAFKRIGHEVKYSFYPWKRAYEMTKSGGASATMPWGIKPDRAENFYYSKPIYSSRYLFFHLKSNPIPNWTQLSDLKSYIIGATREFTYTEAFWDSKETGVLNIEVVTTNEQNLKKILLRRLDLFPLNEIVGRELLNKKFVAEEREQFTTLSKPLVEFPVSILFPKSLKESEKLRNIFDDGFEKLKADGTFGKMHRDLLAGKYTK